MTYTIRVLIFCIPTLLQTKPKLSIFNLTFDNFNTFIEGVKEYFTLMDNRIELVFLKEPYINTQLFKEQLEGYKNIKTTDTDLKPLFWGIKETLSNLAKKQIVIAFEQSEKEVKDLSSRTSESLQVLKAQGKQLGHNKKSLTTKKSIEMKEKIKKLDKDFQGHLKSKEVIEILNIARNTYFKYKKDLKEELIRN